jgi:hypothetical protein
VSSHLAANQLEGNRKGRAVAECAEGDAVALGSAEERLAERMWPDGGRPSDLMGGGAWPTVPSDSITSAR